MVAPAVVAPAKGIPADVTKFLTRCLKESYHGTMGGNFNGIRLRQAESRTESLGHGKIRKILPDDSTEFAEVFQSGTPENL